MPPYLVVGNVLSFFYRYPKDIKSPSKHNIALLYWPLPLSVLCQRLRQIMVLSNPSLISPFFSFSEGIFIRNDF